jgi:hypothetical protein
MFSALGLLPEKSYKPLSDRIPGPLLKASQWLSVPGAYLDDRSMMQTLIPIFAASIFTTSIGSLYVGETVAEITSASAAIGDIAVTSDSVGSVLLPIQVTTSALMAYITALMNNKVTLGNALFIVYYLFFIVYFLRCSDVAYMTALMNNKVTLGNALSIPHNTVPIVIFRLLLPW